SVPVNHPRLSPPVISSTSATSSSRRSVHTTEPSSRICPRPSPGRIRRLRHPVLNATAAIIGSQEGERLAVQADAVAVMQYLQQCLDAITQAASNPIIGRAWVTQHVPVPSL